MAIRGRIEGIVLGLMAATFLVGFPLVAQEPGAAKQDGGAPSAVAKAVSEPPRRLPNYFGQVSLTPVQKEDVYRVRAKHQLKIAELEKQVARMRAEMMTECESVLTDTQKTLLADLRKASAVAKAARKAAAETAKKVGEAPKKEAN